MAATARPWSLHWDDETVIVVADRGAMATQIYIASCLERGSDPDEDRPTEEAKANAALIVRAVNCHDELLAALKEVVAISDRKHDAWDKAKAAIAKAERPGAA
jgi:hypothetical protein